jgi:hypothetical protein
METLASEVFYPSRRNGLLLHIGAALLLGGASGVCFWQLSVQESQASFLWLLLAGVVLLLPLPVALYDIYALLSASYTLERDGLRLRWGLRGEDIPLQEIEWLRNAQDLGFQLPLPLVHLPGAILGSRNVEGLGQVEFLAADARNLLLVATPRRIFVISPSDTRAFERAFRRSTEMGSLSPMAAYSTEPVVFVRQLLADRMVRILLAISTFLVIALLVVVALQLPGRELISLGFDGRGQPREPVPAQQLLLLPLLGAIVLVADLFAGVILYHRWKQHLIAYLLWGSSALMSLMLIIAAAQIS